MGQKQFQYIWNCTRQRGICTGARADKSSNTHGIIPVCLDLIVHTDAGEQHPVRLEWFQKSSWNSSEMPGTLPECLEKFQNCSNNKRKLPKSQFPYEP